MTHTESHAGGGIEWNARTLQNKELGGATTTVEQYV